MVNGQGTSCYWLVQIVWFFVFIVCNSCIRLSLGGIIVYSFISQNTTFPLRERSERLGLSAWVKHGHVVPSKNCKWLPFDYVHHSIQTLVALMLDKGSPNCQSHYLSISLAHALWPFLCSIRLSSWSMSSDLSCLLVSDSTHVILKEFELML